MGKLTNLNIYWFYKNKHSIW